MRPKVKICGITNLIDAKNAISLGADYLGFVNITNSPRYVAAQELEEIVKNFDDIDLKKFVLLTAESSLDSIISLSSKLSIKIIQPYASITKQDLGKLRLLGYKIFKPVRVATEDDISEIAEYLGCSDVVILDSKSTVPDQLGGTGEVFDWNIFLKAKETYDHKLALAGGLSPENIQESLASVQPYMIDLSSGVESKPGLKSLSKMKEIFRVLQADTVRN